jgi:hypothetical protein
MNNLLNIYKKNWRKYVLIKLFLLAACILLVYRLGTLTKGVSLDEVMAATNPVGFHGIFHEPLYLPIKLIRSIVFYIRPVHGALLTRLPNVFFGLLSIGEFAVLIRIWHNRKVALLSTLIFTCGAWTLHVSRLASFDVLYLWGIITLLLGHALNTKYPKDIRAWYLNLFSWGLLLTIPGFVWLVAADIYLQRADLADGWKDHNKIWQKLFSVILPLLWLPLVLKNIRYEAQAKLWIGLPAQFPSVLKLLKQFIAVFVHLFFRGPQYPSLWLGKAPLFDAFSLVMGLIGIYFYTTRFRSGRSHLLATMFIISTILIGVGGAASLSLDIGLIYVMVAMGIAYMLHNWTKVFPLNPLARTLGIGLLTLAVVISCAYNIRSYFVAWPLNPASRASFNYHLKN